MKFINLLLSFIPFAIMAQNVGIGTTSPLEKLHISNGQIRLSRTGSYENNVVFNMPASTLAGEHEGMKFLLLGTEKAFIGYTSTSTSGNFIRLSGAGINANDLVIDATGRVGIGLNTPSEKLHVKGSMVIDDANPTLQLQNAGVNKGFLQLSADNIRIGTNSGNETGKFIIRNNGGDRVFVTAGGSMGINMADPAASLHINSGSSIEALRIEGTGSTIIRMMTGITEKASFYATGNDLNISLAQANGLLRLNGEVYINNTSARTGIGTTTPEERLHVAGNLKVSGNIYLDGAEVNRTNTTEYNLLPAVYGRVNSLGSKSGGTPNFTCEWVGNIGYFFRVKSANINTSSVVSVTIAGSNGAAKMPVVNVVDGWFEVKFFNDAGDYDWSYNTIGAAVPFHFVVYTP